MTHIHQKIRKPSQFLVENIDVLPRGKALDLAMGNGRNAVFLAKRGFDVEGVDISAESVKRALKLAHNSGVTINALVADLENSYRIEKDTYKIIVCFNYLYRPIIQQIKEGLCRGGMVVYETFIVDQAKFGKPKNPDHLLKHNELLDLFREFRCLRYHEGIFENQRALAGIIAQKT
jgi:SAM-dependent methyltransferase